MGYLPSYLHECSRGGRVWRTEVGLVVVMGRCARICRRGVSFSSLQVRASIKEKGIVDFS